MSAPTIAVTGVDGAGKTTLLRTLRRRVPALATAPVLKRLVKPNARALASRGGTWADGAVLPEDPVALGWATTLDFVRFVDRHLGPAEALEGPLLLDRWSACVAAYAEGVLGAQGAADVALAVPQPDLVLHLELDPAVAHRRITATRRASPDENPELLARFAEAYHEVLPRLPGRVVVIDASDPDRATDEAQAIIEELAAAPARPTPTPGQEAR